MSMAMWGIIAVPVGILLMAAAFLWQMYTVLSESYSLDRFKDKQLVWVVSAMFFSFSLALYAFAPNARKKGIVFFLLGFSGVALYFLGQMWVGPAPS